jgi:hypothetical protein
MFFSTPHWGMQRSDWGVFVRCVLQQYAPAKGISPTPSMIQTLSDSATSIYNISENFLPLQKDMAFVSFVEDQPIQGLGEVVSNSSKYSTTLIV